MANKKPNIRKLRVLLIALSIFFVSIILFIGWFVWALLTDEPPQFFPLNNPQGIYRITRGCPEGQGWTKNVETNGKGYCMEYTGTGIFQTSGALSSDFFRITIGNSQMNLEPLVGKTVKNIKGKYTSSSKQCVLNKCIDIGGPYVVLDLQKVEVEK